MVRIVRLLALCVVLPALGAEAHAQTYPVRPVRMIIPFTPGVWSESGLIVAL